MYAIVDTEGITESIRKEGRRFTTEWTKRVACMVVKMNDNPEYYDAILDTSSIVKLDFSTTMECLKDL